MELTSVASAHTTLAQRLDDARRRRFIGRDTEVERFRSIVTAAVPPVAVLFVHGPGGVGKTALLAAFGRVADESRATTVTLDGRSIDPSPAGFQMALTAALPCGEGRDPLVALADLPRPVLLIDTYERIHPLDGWLREEFLPHLPASVLVVIAGRDAPTLAWRSDPGWSDLIRVLSLRNLAPDASRAFLHARNVPEEQHAGVLAFTHGHPLALSLVADVLALGESDSGFDPAGDPNIVRALLDRLLHDLPIGAYRHALEVCAHARVTSEALLAAALEIDDAGEIFNWLRSLALMEQGSQGLFPHDLVREVLDRDLRWRNPDDYHDLHDRIRAYVVQRLMSTTGIEQQRAFFDLLYLHRTNPIVRPIYRWSSLGTAWAEPATPGDHATILAAVRRHEGEESAQIAAHWLERQPGAFTVFRRAGEPVAGFIASIALQAATAEDLEVDPVARAADAFASRSAPARPDDVLLLHRYAIDCERYQAYDGLWEMFCMQSGTQWLTTPRLAWTFIVVADPDRDLPFMTYLRFQRSREAEAVVGDRSYGVFTHDWRVEPPLVWLDVMHARELAHETHIQPPVAHGLAPLIVLSRPDFDAAVRQALRDYHRADALATNPLLRSRLLVDHDRRAPAVSIRHLLDCAIDTLRNIPRDERLYRAIERTYLRPAASQELAAEALGLPFSTYRYHLTHGLKRVADWLWQRDVAAGGTSDA